MTDRAASLGLGLATALVAGNMIGSGIYLLPASLAAYGSIGLVGWLGAFVAAGVYAAMFACVPSERGGAGQGFTAPVVAAFGRNTGFVAGSLYWVQAILGNVAIALAVTGYLIALFPALGVPQAMVLTTLAVIWTFVLVNMLSARLVGYIEAATLVVGLLPVLLVATAGWFYFDAGLFFREWNISGRASAVIAPEIIVLALWAFLGLESASVAAKLVKNPKRNVALATVGGVLLSALIYIAASTVLSGIMPAAALAASTAPFADATALILGSSLGALVAICAALKACGTLSGWILLAAQSAEAAASVDDGAALKNGAAGRRQSFIISGVIMSAIVVVTADGSIAAQFSRLANAVVVVTICVYAMVGAALIYSNGSSEGRRWTRSRLLGGASIFTSLAIVATQDVFTIAATASLIIAVITLRILQVKASLPRVA